MTKSNKNSAATSLLNAMVANPQQRVVVLNLDWENAEPVIDDVKVDRAVMVTPIAKTSTGEEIAHQFSVLTHAALQRLGKPMCFNEVRKYLSKILNQVSICDLGAELHKQTLSQITTIEGGIAEAALQVCIDYGVYKPVTPVIQTLPIQSGRGPR